MNRLKKNLLNLLDIFLIMIVLLINGAFAFADTADEFWEGDGTLDNPYLISCADDLLRLEREVNSGKTFTSQYFVQTENIDLYGIIWTPIGIFGTDFSFGGTYDGNGHYVTNLVVESDSYFGNVGFFGQLGGTVMNFGIESGDISGTCVGSITSHSSSATATIINCYSKANVSGARAGGIADNFNGSIINCWSDCVLSASSSENIGDIVSYAANSIVNCLHLDDYRNSADFVAALNRNIYKSASLSALNYNDLNIWGTDENGNVILLEQKAGVSLTTLPAIIIYNWIYILPALITISSIAILLILTRAINVRKQPH